jgi:hypothetical protein
MPRAHVVDLRWKAILNDFRRSGLTQAEFCRRRDISLHSFRKHLYSPRRSHDQRPSAFADQRFLPVTILAALLAGIDLNSARRRPRYARPAIPIQNPQENAPTLQHPYA